MTPPSVSGPGNNAISVRVASFPPRRIENPERPGRLELGAGPSTREKELISLIQEHYEATGTTRVVNRATRHQCYPLGKAGRQANVVSYKERKRFPPVE